MLLKRMKRLICVTAILVLAGCASVPPPVAGPVPPVVTNEKVDDVKPEPVAPKAVDVVAEPAPAPAIAERPAVVAPPPDVEEKPDAPGERVLVIESIPSDATVVVNGLPAGRTPLRLRLVATSRGFFRDETTIRVRFIATNASEASATVEDVFAVTDRVPVRVVFTAEGARRVW